MSISTVYYITGLPGIGKTTRANQIKASTPPTGNGRAHISTDFIREIFPNIKRKQTVAILRQLYDRAVHNGLDIIVEEPYQSLHYTEDIWFKYLMDRGYSVIHEDMNWTEVNPLAVSRRRRANTIPIPILDEQYIRYLANPKNDDSINQLRIGKLFPKDRPIYFVDFDGTLFDTREKFRYTLPTSTSTSISQPNQKLVIDWKYVFSPEGIRTDKLRKEVLELVPDHAVCIALS